MFRACIAAAMFAAAVVVATAVGVAGGTAMSVARAITWLAERVRPAFTRTLSAFRPIGTSFEARRCLFGNHHARLNTQRIELVRQLGAWLLSARLAVLCIAAARVIAPVITARTARAVTVTAMGAVAARGAGPWTFAPASAAVPMIATRLAVAIFAAAGFAVTVHLCRNF